MACMLDLAPALRGSVFPDERGLVITVMPNELPKHISLPQAVLLPDGERPAGSTRLTHRSAAGRPAARRLKREVRVDLTHQRETFRVLDGFDGKVDVEIGPVQVLD
jgi:hypothetical protein